MNVLFISIDSLRQDCLTTYRERPRGFDYAVETDNLDRFAERATVFDNHYAGSLFCMPARREWFTGIREFLWRSWGPIEPFDRTLPRAARENGNLAKLITDHYHYFQHGSHGYFEDFNGFEFVRGHEADSWKTTPQHPDEDFLEKIEADNPESLRFMNRAQYARNVADFDFADESDFFAPKVFGSTADWLNANQDWDEWFCYVDSFDVHEPLHCPEPYASMYTDQDPADPDLSVWPRWGRVDEGQAAVTDRQLEFMRAQFAGKVTMVDRHFGRVLNVLDERDLWDETIVVVTSDHGISLGDHGWIGKVGMPLYDVVAQTPLMVWHPDAEPDRVDALTSAVDLYPTLMEAFGADIPEYTHGRSLTPLVLGEREEHRDLALFGNWGAEMNITDGEYTYHHPCDTEIDSQYFSSVSLTARMPFHPPDPVTDAEADSFLPYTDVPVWRFDGPSFNKVDEPLLFDTVADPRQERNVADDEQETVARMRGLLTCGLDRLDAPSSQYERLNLTKHTCAE